MDAAMRVGSPFTKNDINTLYLSTGVRGMINCYEYDMLLIGPTEKYCIPALMYYPTLAMSEEHDPTPVMLSAWIVEDSKQFRKVLRSIIEETEDMQCTGEFASVEALEDHLNKANPLEVPAVVLMDIRLPGRSGIEGTRMLKERFPDLSIVILTLHHQEEMIYSALQAGAIGYLLKGGMESDQMLMNIREAASGAMVMPAEIAKKVQQFFETSPKKDKYGLTRREIEVLQKMCDGLTQKDIGQALYISANTVGQHIRSIYHKLQVNTKAGAVAKAIRKRIIK